MRTRFTKLIAGLGVVAAIAVGGATFASAAKKAPPPTPPAAATPAAAATTPAAPVDGDTLQQGDQTAPDTGTAPEQTAEAATSETGSEPAGEASSEVAGNDGPGGHADEPGNPNADHQFEGVE